MKTTVYLIRHAEAEGNVYRRCHGIYDSLLTPRAYRQLKYLAKRFEKVNLDKVYASDLFRARNTAKAIAETKSLQVNTDPGLREIDVGDWEDLAWAEIERFWPEDYAIWKSRPWESSPPNGESPIEAGLRMLNCVKGIVKENEGKTIAVVTHGSAIRGALALAKGWDAERLSEQGWGDNTCVSKLEFEGPGHIGVVYENDASHLPEELSTFAAVGWKDITGMPENVQLWFRRADPLDKADSELLLSFMRELYTCAYGTDEYLDPESLISEMLESQKASPRAVTFGCLGDGPVALAYLKAYDDTEPDTGLVGGFCIKKEYRGAGVGKQLIGQAVSVYRNMGKKYICSCPSKKNKNAISFYLKNGFEKKGEFTDVRGPHLKMAKSIMVTR